MSSLAIKLGLAVKSLRAIAVLDWCLGLPSYLGLPIGCSGVRQRSLPGSQLPGGAAFHFAFEVAAGPSPGRAAYLGRACESCIAKSWLANGTWL